MSISVVVVSIKYQYLREKTAAKKFDLTINFDFFDLITWNALMV